MYAAIIFLYYFNDLTGSLLTALIFCLSTLGGSIVAVNLSEIWYGIGVFTGAFLGWCSAYYRLNWLEDHLDEHVFCRGSILETGHGKQPDSKVFDRYSLVLQQIENEEE